MNAIILAGGFGTRLRSVVSNMPKPMADINGQPFLSYIMDQLIETEIEKIIIAVGYKYEIITSYYNEEYKGVPIEYSIERKPLGTGGCIRKALEYCNSKEIFLLNGDSFFDIDLLNLQRVYQETNADIVIASKLMSNVNRYGSLEIINNRVVGFHEKKWLNCGNVNCGVYYTAKDLFNEYVLESKFSMENDFLKRNVNNLNMQMAANDGYFVDIGIPEDYEQAKDHFRYK